MVCSMIQSVAYIHSLGFVHGDVKPSNWLVDRATNRPLLCDFETAKDRGLGGVTGAVTAGATSTAASPLLTRGFAAPEVLQNPHIPKSRTSDVYSLGLSIKYLLDVVICHDEEMGESSLRNLVKEMTKENPHERITALEAQQSDVFK